MAPLRKLARTSQARRILAGKATHAESSDDDSSDDERGWEWVCQDADKSTKSNSQGRKRKSEALNDERSIIGAKKGNVEIRLGDTVVIQGSQGEPWVGIVQELFEDEEEDDKMGRFIWFNYPKEIRNKSKQLQDVLPNEMLISAASDVNALETINGKAIMLSEAAFAKKYPSGSIPKRSKDHGKVFVCRRGVNMRTATYTEPFVWEKTYRGFEDIDALLELVQSQTQSTRKKSPKPKKEKDLDDFVAADDDDYDGPITPRKRQKTKDARTPTSKRKDRTPSKHMTPTHKRIVVKKPLEFTPLGTRILSPSALSSPFQQARNQLHVSSVPASLPCREEEFSTVYSHLDAAITDGTGSCIYISGTPGTGKTATVREVVAQLNSAVLAEELDDFIFVEINGMKVTDPHQSYSLLWEALKGDRVSPSHALELLEKEFSTGNPRRVPCVVLMDELDQLVTKNQSVMYNFFNWPSLANSRLIVLAVANTMDLPERTLSNKISSRLGLTRITFPGYTHDQLMQIIQSRLSNVPNHIVHPDAIQFAARKVAAVSGDARRALDICRRAVEIAETESIAAEKAAGDEDADDATPNTPSRTGRARGTLKPINASPAKAQASPSKPQAPAAKKAMVTIATIKAAINEATSSPLQQYLRSLPMPSKVFLAALLARVRRTGIQESVLADVIDEAKRLALTSQNKPIEDFLLATDPFAYKAAKASASAISASAKNDIVVPAIMSSPGGIQIAPARISDARATRFGVDGGKAMSAIAVASARVQGLSCAAVELLEAGIVGVEVRRGERVGRVRLGVGEEEVRLALKGDVEAAGLGVGA